MDPLEAWLKAGSSTEDWAGHVLRKAHDRRDLSQFYADTGAVKKARTAMRSALARELYVASLRGQATATEVAAVKALLPIWTGASSDELLATVRTILTDRAVCA